MDTFTAVKNIDNTPLKKTDFLLFDKVAVPDLQFNLREATPELRAEYEYLVHSGMLLEVRLDEILDHAAHSDKRAEALFKLASGLELPFVSRYLTASSREKIRQFTNRVIIEQIISVTADRVEKVLRTRATPIVDLSPVAAYGEIGANLPMMLGLLETVRDRVRGEPRVPATSQFLDVSANIAHLLQDFEDAPVQTSPVVQITMEALPILDESTPWEQIVEFRNDETTRTYSLGLRKWMRKVTDTAVDPVEIKEELEGLVVDYKDHMRFHRPGIVETVLTMAGNVAEHAMKKEFGAAARALFQVRHERIRLLESERDAPGREVAYIVKAQEAFKR